MQMSGILIKSSIVQGPSTPPSLPALLEEGRGRGTAIPAGLGTLFESGKPQLISKEEA